MVMAVDDHGPGAAAGVRQGDVIVAWDGKPLPGISALLRALGPESVGRAVTIALHRGGEPTELTLTIGERAAA
jgi:S1-C subfamily serine protease